MKLALQNGIDRLSDDNADNIEFALFTTAPLDVNAALRKIRTTNHEFSSDAVSITVEDEIERCIQRAKEVINTVKEEKIKIDHANNYLEYESNDLDGIVVNVLSTSIVNLYNKYSGKGLFDLNIRRYIRNKLVDGGIQSTLDKDRENFWFLNNGLIIACTDYSVDGDTVKLYDFSIVNGGQTTHMIGNYKGTNNKEFYIPCKIVATKDDSRAGEFYTKIAEATNSQKPIYPRDLKSNSPEMVKLNNWLKTEGIYLEIKRGYKEKGQYKYSIKNDELGQLILSFVYQQPGTSRSGKKKIFDTPATYDKIFKFNYEKEFATKQMLLDLIDLDNRYVSIENELKTDGSLSSEQSNVMKNGKQTIFGLLGVCYRLVNDDLTKNDLINNGKSLASIPMVHGPLLSNYKADDIDKKLTNLVRILIRIVTDSYQRAFNNGTTTSVSNYMKTDSRYYSDIVKEFGQSLDYMLGQDIRECIKVFKRN